MSKPKLVEGGHKFPIRRYKQSIPIPSSSDQVLLKNSCTFRGFILPHTDHRENDSSYVLVQNTKDTLVRTTTFCSISCLFSIVYGQYVARYQFPARDYFFWWMSLSCLMVCEHTGHSYLGSQNPERSSITLITQWKVTVLRSVQANFVVDPYYINNE